MKLVKVNRAAEIDHKAEPFPDKYLIDLCYENQPATLVFDKV